MKKLLYTIYIGLMLPFALACEKQNIEPTGEFTDIVSDTLEAKAASCVSYSFFHKDFGTVELGNARGATILVGFKNTSTAAKLQLLSKYPRFDAIQSEGNIDSGPVTVIRLKAGTTCHEAEAIMKGLKSSGNVLYTGPTFDPFSVQEGIMEWMGLTNEFLVVFEGAENSAHFKKIAEKTNTQIVTTLADFDGFYIYVMKADKGAKGSLLDICTLFNQQPYVWEAVPNYYYKLLPWELETSSAETLTTTAEQIKQKGLSALKNPNR